MRCVLSRLHESVWRYGRSVQVCAPMAKSLISRSLGPLRAIVYIRWPTAGIIAAVATLALAAGWWGATAATATPAQRDPAGLVAGRVVFGRHETGAVVTVVRCVRQSRPLRTSVGGCPAEAGIPQSVARVDLRPGDDRFRLLLKPGHYRLEDQLAKRSTPFGCIDASHQVSVRAHHTSRVTLHLAILRGCVDGRWPEPGDALLPLG